MINMSTDIGMPVILANNMDIPVTPPSMNLVDNKNPFMPIPAESIPKMIRMKFSICILAFMVKDSEERRKVKGWVD